MRITAKKVRDVTWFILGTISVIVQACISIVLIEYNLINLMLQAVRMLARAIVFPPVPSGADHFAEVSVQFSIQLLLMALGAVIGYSAWRLAVVVWKIDSKESARSSKVNIIDLPDGSAAAFVAAKVVTTQKGMKPYTAQKPQEDEPSGK